MGSVGLKITSMKWSGQQDADDTGEIPEDIDYIDIVPRENLVNIDRANGVAETISSSQSKLSYHIKPSSYTHAF